MEFIQGKRNKESDIRKKERGKSEGVLKQVQHDDASRSVMPNLFRQPQSEGVY